MGSVWVLLKNNLYVSVFKKKYTFLLGLFAPILVILIMGKILNFGSPNLSVGIVDNDNSMTSRSLVEFIDETDAITTIKVDKKDIDNRFSEKVIDGLVVFPKGFEDGLIQGNLNKITIKGRETSDTPAFLKNIIYSEVVNMKKLAYASQNDRAKYIKLVDNYKNNGEVKVQKEHLSDLKSDYLIANVFVGFIIFFMLLRGSNGTVHYFDEKRDNIFNRIFLAPIKSYQYYLADLLSNYLVIVIQAVVGVVGIEIIGVNTGISSIHLLIIMCVVGLVSVSLAICIRSFCTHYNEFLMVFNFIIMVLTMFGGCFVPIDMFPTVVDNISYMTPTRWAMDAIYDLQLGLEFRAVISKILIILLFALLLFLVGAYKTSKSEKEFSSL